MSDLIRRQDAIRWVKTECNPYGKPTLDFESSKKVIEHLGQMPSEDRGIGDDLFCKSQLITCNRVKECNGVCPFEDALQHADKDGGRR